MIAPLAPQAPLPNLPLGPYETQLIEMIPSERPVVPPVARQISIPIAGVKRLALIVEDAGDNIQADQADWAEARLLR